MQLIKGSYQGFHWSGRGAFRPSRAIHSRSCSANEA
jgi:hypothetical protein